MLSAMRLGDDPVEDEEVASAGAMHGLPVTHTPGGEGMCVVSMCVVGVCGVCVVVVGEGWVTVLCGACSSVRVPERHRVVMHVPWWVVLPLVPASPPHPTPPRPPSQPPTPSP